MEEEKEAHNNHRRRLCDYCDSSVALLYCKADSAKLCLACDKEVHVANQLFAKHFRSLLCDSCHDSPSSVFCETEKSVLCQNCDWEHHHNSIGGSSSSSSSVVVHNGRRPVEGFSGCPSVTEFLAIVGIDDLSEKADSGSGGSEMLLWETPEIVSLNDMIGSGGSGHNFRAMDVPPLPKNRHAICGKHKDEMIGQLRKLAKTEPSCLKYETLDTELDTGFQFLATENHDDLFEVSGLKWFEGSGEDQQDEVFPYGSMLTNLYDKPDNVKNRRCDRESSSMMVPVSDGLNPRCEEETVMVPVNTTTATTKSIIPSLEINSLERNSALSRYKAKKKSRRYEKHIRYESRKVRAESRTRIRGRFAKADP